MDRAWILLGMMGAGKSSIGRSLAALTGREFHDTDLMLQQRFGRPVGQIFDIYGESTFRDHETSILRAIEPGPIVLATGGGIVTRDENWTHLHRIGITVFLQASADTILERLENSKKRRPLLEREDWKAHARNLIDQRTHLYQRADITINVDGENLETGPSRVLEAITSFETR